MNKKQLSLDALRTFVTIIQHGGFARAGDIVGRSQPAISLQIKKLEQQVGKKLFQKKGQRYVPTVEGNWLHEQALRMLAINDEVFHYMTDSGLSGRVRLGIPSEFASLLLPSIIGEFAAHYPDISLDVTSALSKTLLNSNNTNQYDVVLALTTEQNSQAAAHWVTDEIVWVGDHKHIPSPTNIALVLAADGCVYRSRVIEKLKQQTVPWRIAYTNSDLGGLSAAIQQGLGITALSKRTVPKELSIINHSHLPHLGQIHIGLFELSPAQRAGQQRVIVETLVSFLAKRLMGSNYAI